MPTKHHINISTKYTVHTTKTSHRNRYTYKIFFKAITEPMKFPTPPFFFVFLLSNDHWSSSRWLCSHYFSRSQIIHKKWQFYKRIAYFKTDTPSENKSDLADKTVQLASFVFCLSLFLLLFSLHFCFPFFHFAHFSLLLLFHTTNHHSPCQIQGQGTNVLQQGGAVTSLHILHHQTQMFLKWDRKKSKCI